MFIGIDFIIVLLTFPIFFFRNGYSYRRGLHTNRCKYNAENK